MNDRFKFRVWDNKEEIYIEELDIVRLTQYGAFVFNNAENNTEPTLNPNRFIFEQCTGLKDKNGKFIYENDIIQKENHKFIVKYDFDSFKAYDKENCPISIYGLFTFKICNSGWPEKENENTIEVIGNIHENPELQEEDK